MNNLRQNTTNTSFNSTQTQKQILTFGKPPKIGALEIAAIIFISLTTILSLIFFIRWLYRRFTQRERRISENSQNQESTVQKANPNSPGLVVKRKSSPVSKQNYLEIPDRTDREKKIKNELSVEMIQGTNNNNQLSEDSIAIKRKVKSYRKKNNLRIKIPIVK